MIVINLPEEFVIKARKAVEEGDQYALEMFRLLVQKYGADPRSIDMECLREQGLGQAITSMAGKNKIVSPADLLTTRLPLYSDTDLKKHGLSRTNLRGPK